MDSFLRNMITARLNIGVFPGGYDYRSVEVNGTEYTDVAVPLIYMAAGLQCCLTTKILERGLLCTEILFTFFALKSYASLG